MFCSNCGREFEETARYCSACGTPRATVRPPVSESYYRPFARIQEGKKVAGVCGGVARYFDLDVSLVRVLWVLLTICPPLPGIVAYIVCWIVMPQDPLPSAANPSPQSSY